MSIAYLLCACAGKHPKSAAFTTESKSTSLNPNPKLVIYMPSHYITFSVYSYMFDLLFSIQSHYHLPSMQLPPREPLRKTPLRHSNAVRYRKSTQPRHEIQCKTPQPRKRVKTPSRKSAISRPRTEPRRARNLAGRRLYPGGTIQQVSLYALQIIVREIVL